jgi:hypothetical protein
MSTKVERDASDIIGKIAGDCSQHQLQRLQLTFPVLGGASVDIRRLSGKNQFRA